jgi:thioredoxin 2
MSTLSLDQQGVVDACPSCSQKVRTAYGRLGGIVRCPRCKVHVPAPGAPIEVPTEALFDALVASSSLPVVVDYWAPWCGPCKMVAPELQKVAEHHRGDLLVVKVNTEALPELARRAQIQSIPTMALYRGGKEVSRTVGARPAAGIEAFIGGVIGNG